MRSTLKLGLAALTFFLVVALSVLPGCKPPASEVERPDAKLVLDPNDFIVSSSPPRGPFIYNGPGFQVAYYLPVPDPGKECTRFVIAALDGTGAWGACATLAPNADYSAFTRFGVIPAQICGLTTSQGARIDVMLQTRLAALDSLRRLAPELNALPDRLAGGGTSSAGHMTLMEHEFGQYRWSYSIAGPTHIPALYAYALANDAALQARYGLDLPTSIELAFTADQNIQTVYSPIFNPRSPAPVDLIHASGDLLVPVNQARAELGVREAFGLPTRLTEVVGDHGVVPPESAAIASQAITDGLLTHYVAPSWAEMTASCSGAAPPPAPAALPPRICGRGGAGVFCSESTGGSFTSARLLAPFFSDAAGFSSSPSFWQTIDFPDLDGDGNEDLCMRGGAGYHCALLDPGSHGYGDVTLWSDWFSDPAGFGSSPSYWKSRAFADLNGDGKTDVCMRGGTGLWCALSNGVHFGQATLWGDWYSDAAGFGTQPFYYETLALPDINGDGKADVCMRGWAGYWCGLSNGFGFTDIHLASASFGDGAGFQSQEYYWRVARFTDLNGDRKADVCMRGWAGMHCAVSDGENFQDFHLWTAFNGDAAGFATSPSFYETGRFGDLDGDGKADFCMRGWAGFHCVRSTGSSFGDPTLWEGVFSDARGFNASPSYYQTAALADLNGDGKADLCARTRDGITCGLSTGSNFSPPALFTASFSDPEGWNVSPSYYETIRIP